MDSYETWRIIQQAADQLDPDTARRLCDALDAEAVRVGYPSALGRLQGALALCARRRRAGAVEPA